MVFGNLLGILDRLSVQSILSGKTTSFFGLIATLGLILTVVLVFIGPVINYFNGDYFQSRVDKLQLSNPQFNSNTDYKIAIAFRNQVTNEYVQHSTILTNLDSNFMLTLNNVTYKSALLPCQRNYFSDAINPVILDDCLIIPSDKLFDLSGFVRLSFAKKCVKPFECKGSTAESNISLAFLTNLLNTSYYTVYFTSKVLNAQGYPQLQVHKIYQTDFFKPGSIGTYLINVYYDVQTAYADNSIMPWRNNMTMRTLQWSGTQRGVTTNAASLSAQNIDIVFTIRGNQGYLYRYYKKLDSTLGILGGGIFLFFLIFYCCCNCYNLTSQKRMIPQIFLLISRQRNPSNLNQIKSEKIPWTICFTNFFCWNNPSQNLRRQAEEKLNISSLIKKMKLIANNLKVNKIPSQKRCVQLTNIEMEERQPVIHNQQSQKLGLHPQVVRSLKQSQKIPPLYQDNATILLLKQTQDNNEAIEDQKIKKTKNLNKKISTLSYIFKVITDFFRNFDVFGGKPNFLAQPYNSSCFSCLIVSIIVILSVLTFSLTIFNMDKPQLVIEDDLLAADNTFISLITGQNIRLAACWANPGFSSYVIGTANAKRVAVQLFTTASTGGVDNTRTYDLIQISNATAYLSGVGSTCVQIPDNIVVSTGVKGNTQYTFGIQIVPFCYGTPAQCANKTNATLTDFFFFMNNFGQTFIMSENSYDVFTQSFTVTTGKSNRVLQSLQTQNLTQNAIEQQTYFDSVSVYDDSKGLFQQIAPKLINATLSFNEYFVNEYPRVVNSTTPYYKYVIRPTGKNKKIIFKSYPISFLLGTIGGVFLFFYFFFHWIGQIYNSFKVKSKVAEKLYGEDMHNYDCVDVFWVVFKLPVWLLPGGCLANKRKKISQMLKIEKKVANDDLNAYNLARNIDTTYKLSSELFSNKFTKSLSRIYLKEKIDSRERVAKQVQSEASEDEQQDFQHYDLEEDQFDDDGDISNKSKNMIANEISIEHKKIMSSSQIIQKQPKLSNNQKQQYAYKYSNQQPKGLGSFLKQFDIYNANVELNLNGKRSVRSVIGGCCCIAMFILIIIVVSYFVGLYLSNQSYRIGTKRYVSDPASDKIIQLKVGQNFKFMYSFYRRSKFFFNNVSAFNTLAIKAYQVTIDRSSGSTVITSVPTDFIPCSDDYIGSWSGPYINPVYYSNLTNGFCLPDGTALTISGAPEDLIYKYFYFSIQSTTPQNQTQMVAFFNTFLTNYHFSRPNYQKSLGKFTYQMISMREDTFLRTFAVDYNMTLNKFIVNVDGGDAPTPPKGIQTYDYTDYHFLERSQSFTLTNTSAWKNLTFNYNNIVREYNVKYTKISQIFGLVGGVIIFFIAGAGCFAKSFNNFRMKYLIAREIYRFQKIQRNKPIRKSDLIQPQQQKSPNFNEAQLLLCWFLSFIAYIRGNYNFNNSLRMVTLMRQRIQQDLSIFNILPSLRAYERSINHKKHLQNQQIKLTKVYIKDIYFPQHQDTHYSTYFKRIATRDKISCYQQKKLDNALIHGDIHDIQTAFNNDQLIKKCIATYNQASIHDRHKDSNVNARNINQSMQVIQQQKGLEIESVQNDKGDNFGLN